MAIGYYDYHDWVTWSEHEILEYAQDIAAEWSLSLEEQKYLESKMCDQAGFWTLGRFTQFPKKMDAQLEAQFRELGNCDDEVLKQNARLNAPDEVKPDPRNRNEYRWEVIGKGLTRRTVRQVEVESPFLRKERIRAERMIRKKPFHHLVRQMRMLADDAMWAAQSYPISSDEWLVFGDSDNPYEGLVWYAHELHNACNRALEEMRLKNFEPAMECAFSAGQLSAEIAVLIRHGKTFDKYEAVRRAQIDAATARKKVPDEIRRETYWQYRNDGHKRIEAGRLAADQLGLSEGSIRNAFPDSKYPAD